MFHSRTRNADIRRKQQSGLLANNIYCPTYAGQVENCRVVFFNSEYSRDSLETSVKLYTTNWGILDFVRRFSRYKNLIINFPRRFGQVQRGGIEWSQNLSRILYYIDIFILVYLYLITIRDIGVLSENVTRLWGIAVRRWRKRAK